MSCMSIKSPVILRFIAFAIQYHFLRSPVPKVYNMNFPHALYTYIWTATKFYSVLICIKFSSTKIAFFLY